MLRKIAGFAAFFALFAQFSIVFGQSGRQSTARSHNVNPINGLEGSFTPQWESPVAVQSILLPEVNFKAPWFKGANLDSRLANLSYYEFSLSLLPGEELKIERMEAIGVTEENTDLFSLSARESTLGQNNGWYPSSHVILGERIQTEGKISQQVFIYPILVGSDGNRIRKAATVEYLLRRQVNNSLKKPSSKVAWSNNSVLGTGDWYKIPVTAEGIYKIDYSYLQNLGLDPSTIDPRTLRIHGIAGDMLPQTAGTRKFDDLPENSIYVEGENDGSFDNNDYLLFYGTSPHSKYYHDSLARFVHRYNIYSDSNFYFLTYGDGNGQRVQSVASAGGANFTPPHALNFTFYEKDIFNILKSGRVWLGETFDLVPSQTFSFGLPKLAPGTNIDLVVRACADSNTPSNFTFKEGNNTLASLSIPVTSTAAYSYVYRTSYAQISAPSSIISDGSFDLEMVYSKPLSTSEGFLDYIELQYRQSLDLGSINYFPFSFAENTGPGAIFDVSFSNVSAPFLIWDVTNPLEVQSRQFNLSGSNLSFGLEADSVKNLMAFTTNGARTPSPGKKIGPQNLHGQESANYLIVCYPAFKSAAERLAQFHRDHYGRTVQVATTSEVYNEFSGGSLDPVAIRDYFKMFYDRALTSRDPLRFAVLIGDGSYDYKNRVTATVSNFIPSYQARRSERATDSFTSDDFFAFLDDGEGFWSEGAAYTSSTTDILWFLEGDVNPVSNHGLDIGLGRIPVATPDEADYMVDKIIRYATSLDGFGSWRNRLIIVADHKDSDSDTHVTQADSYSDDIYNSEPCVNIDKIYMDNYQLVNTASGTRFPDGKEALLNELNLGSLVVNYTGHGGEVGWSNSSILDISDINRMENGDRMPVYITATCEFGRFDDPALRSAAEMLFMKQDGGSIAMMTTVRVVYSSPNYTLNNNLYRYILVSDTATGSHFTLGEIFKKGKNISWGAGSINNRNFTLMGDPGIILNYPELSAIITKINGITPTASNTDSLATLTLVTVEGEVQDRRGNFLSGYSGDLSVTVFDKPTKLTTKRAPYTFYWQKNKIFIGTSSITNGRFTFQFVIPVDVSYEDGKAKISMYFENGIQDGNGCYDNLYVGGTDSTSVNDDVGPLVDLFMNDLKFVDGGMVSPDPVLIAELFDDYGINTVGTGIGHELTGILDGNENEVIVLNDFYASKKDSYKEGTINYPFHDLSIGEHNLRVKVWDVANNSSEGFINFVVASDASMALGHVLNYPNPFTTNTRFIIEHNRNGTVLDVAIKIYSVGGHLVKTLEDSFFAEGNLFCDLTWDGLDDYGDAIGRGVYVYQVQVRDHASGDNISKFEKLVLLR